MHLMILDSPAQECKKATKSPSGKNAEMQSSRNRKVDNYEDEQRQTRVRKGVKKKGGWMRGHDTHLSYLLFSIATDGDSAHKSAAVEVVLLTIPQFS